MQCKTTNNDDGLCNTQHCVWAPAGIGDSSHGRVSTRFNYRADPAGTRN